jgi:hypothetical protein
MLVTGKDGDAGSLMEARSNVKIPNSNIQISGKFQISNSKRNRSCASGLEVWILELP